MSKLNKAAEYIKHVYAKRGEERTKVIQNFVNVTGIKPQYAHGNIYFNIEDIFTDTENSFSKHNRNYGGVSILGNIGGKTEYLLYYKDLEVMNSYHILKNELQSISNEVSESIDIIHKEHGKPNVDHCLLSI